MLYLQTPAEGLVTLEPDGFELHLYSEFAISPADVFAVQGLLLGCPEFSAGLLSECHFGAHTGGVFLGRSVPS